MQSFINVGATDKETVKELAKSIASILSAAHADEETKRTALKVLAKGVASPTSMSIDNCYFTTEGERSERTEAAKEDS